MNRHLFVSDCGVVTPLGADKASIAAALFSGTSDRLTLRDDLIVGRSVLVGTVDDELPALPAGFAGHICRNNRLMLAALREIWPSVAGAVNRYGADRVAVILGSSTSGIAEGEQALAVYRQSGAWPQGYHYSQQEPGGLGEFAAQALGISGPAYTISAACASSAKAFASGRRLIRAGIVDAAVVGGADTLCRTTLGGFYALQAISKGRCNPFSVNRDGITIGEGAAAFLLSRDEGPVELLGIGESSDAHHPTAPDPTGGGAALAIHAALRDANLAPADIAYVNLHGTGTPLNDAMEGQAVFSVFGSETPCSSTKPLTGHMLGAAGGCEAAFLWMMLASADEAPCLPPHCWDGQADPALPSLHLVGAGARPVAGPRLPMLSTTFGFGGSNVALILGRPC